MISWNSSHYWNLHWSQVLKQLATAEKQSFVLIRKWGGVGSQQTLHKMKFENERDLDANIFQSYVFPLQLVYGKERKIMWPTPPLLRHVIADHFGFDSFRKQLKWSMMQWNTLKIKLKKWTRPRLTIYPPSNCFTMLGQIPSPPWKGATSA